MWLLTDLTTASLTGVRGLLVSTLPSLLFQLRPLAYLYLWRQSLLPSVAMLLSGLLFEFFVFSRPLHRRLSRRCHLLMQSRGAPWGISGCLLQSIHRLEKVAWVVW